MRCWSRVRVLRACVRVLCPRAAQLRADYTRYLLEAATAGPAAGPDGAALALALQSDEGAVSELRDEAFGSYRTCTEHALDVLPATSVLRLSAALNFASFCRDVLREPRLAYETAEQACVPPRSAARATRAMHRRALTLTRLLLALCAGTARRWTRCRRWTRRRWRRARRWCSDCAT